MTEHAGSEVDEFDSDFSLLLDEYILRLDVGVDDSEVFEEGQGEKYLDGEGLDVEGVEGFEVVGFE